MIGEKITMYCSESEMGQHLECNGQAISRTAFSKLFECIGTTFGAGDGSTTFNLPDETPYPTNQKIWIQVLD